MKRDEEADTFWCGVYRELADEHPGLFGAIIARAEAQVVRLSCIYALLDCSKVIRREHVEAALAVWKYCENSCRYIFGDSLGDPLADEILRELRRRPDGMTRTAITNYFKRHKSKGQIDTALKTLNRMGFARETHEQTGGRPAEVWKVVQTAKEAK